MGVFGGRARSGVSLGLMALLAAAVWFHRVEFDAPSAHHTLIQSDTYRYFLPVADFIHDEVSAGRLPLWNPYQMAGQPFMALPVTGALYPLNLALLGIFDANTGLAVHAVLHFFLAGVFTGLLAGRLGLGAAGCSAAAVAYMLSGPMLWGLYIPVHFSTQAWLPALIWALHGLLVEAKLRWAMALSGFATLAFYGGYPQLFLYSAQFCLIFSACGFFLLTPRNSRLRVAGLGILAGGLALGWMMPLLLPQLEFTREASRSLDGLSLEEASFPFIGPPTLIDGMTRNLTDAALGSPSGPGQGVIALPALFMVFALCGLLARGLRGYWVFFMLSGLGIGFLMLGPHTPVFEAYYGLPLTPLFRGPIRMSFLYLFCGAMVVGIGVEGLTYFIGEKRGAHRWATATGLALVLFVAGDSYLRTRLTAARPSSYENIRGAPTKLIEFLRDNPRRPRIYFEIHRLYTPHLLLKAGTMNQFFVAGDYEPSLHRTYLDYFDWSGEHPWHGRSSVLHADRPAAAYIDPRRLDLMSVRFYAALEPPWPNQPSELAQLLGPPGARMGGVNVYERRSALPRAYTVERVQVAPDQKSAIEVVRSPGFVPMQMAVVSGAVESLPGALLENSRAAKIENRIALVRRSPIVNASSQEMVVDASCHKPCLAVLTDLDYPGWRAEVDGEATPIVRVNGMFRGVPLEPGEHRVVYRFEPDSLRWGLWIALFSSIVAALVALAKRRCGRGELGG